MSRDTLSLSNSLGVQVSPRVVIYPFWPDEEIADRKIGTPGNSLAILNGFLPFSNTGTFPAPLSGTFGKCGYVTFDPRPDNVFQIGGAVLDKNFIPLYGKMRFRGQFATPYLNWRGTWSTWTQTNWAFARNVVHTSLLYFVIGRDVSFSDVGAMENVFRYGVSSAIPTSAESATAIFFVGQVAKRVRVYLSSSGNIVNPLQVTVKQGNFATHSSVWYHTDFIWNATTGLGSPEYFVADLDDIGGDMIHVTVSGGGAGESAIFHIRFEMEAKQ